MLAEPEPAGSSAVDPPLTDSGFSSDFAVSDSLTETASSALTAPPPLKYGDLAELGLVHWTPAGFFQKVMEVLEVSTGLPWWSVIALTTVGARVVLAPLMVRSMANSARLAPLQPKMAAFAAEATEARRKGDLVTFQTVRLKQQALMKSAGVNPLASFGIMAAQMSTQFGLFLGLRAMLVLPVEQLKSGGFWHLMDLTASDPYFITPVLTTVLINVQLAVRAFPSFPPLSFDKITERQQNGR